MPAKETKHTNRLSSESSPYLLQHAHNPVDWYAWGEEALQAAREQNKPILLSIGYSACHWCHVMEQESFELGEIASLMNEHFINIKVDREERPDLDAIYMNFVQMTTGSGGWPLTVFLAPDQTPFFGGTYFPPEDSHGRPGFKRVLKSIADYYHSRSEELEKNREEVIRELHQSARLETVEGPLREALMDESFRKLGRQFDPHHGGFGDAPKFPSAMALAFLLRYYKRKKSESALETVNLTLQEMARGGIYDQLGGGFHRYSVDDRWLVPHFEKMLYDNALLARLYLEAYQVTADPFYREIAKETLTYVQREMRDPGGGFYSAQDADSEGEEGKFYVWSPPQVESVLGKAEAKRFNEYFDVTAPGNFEGQNILHHRIDLNSYGKSLNVSPEELKRSLDSWRQKLWEAREMRVKPGRDEKVLAAWNGLMLSTFAEAAWVLNETDYLETALQSAEFLASQMQVKGRLCRSWREGRARLNAYLEDYALVIEGWLATYQASGDTIWLDRAQELMELQFELFWDAEEGNFYFTSSDHEPLVVRQKDYFDNATPSGNSVSCMNLLRLAKFLGKSKYHETAERMLRQIATPLSNYPTAFGYWLQALDFLLGPVQEIAVVGPAAECDQLLQPVRQKFLPNRIVAVAEVVEKDLGKKIPLLSAKTALNGKATAYVCQDYACQRPVTSVPELEKLLAAD